MGFCIRATAEELVLQGSVGSLVEEGQGSTSQAAKSLKTVAGPALCVVGFYQGASSTKVGGLER